jgi:hypothetical protein
MMDRWRLTLISWWLFRIAPWPFPSEQSWYTRDVIVHHQISSVYQRRLTKLMWRWLRRRREGGCLHLSYCSGGAHHFQGRHMSLCDQPPNGTRGVRSLRSQRHLASKVLQDDEPILPVNDDTPRDEGSSGTTTPSGLLEIWGEVLAQTLQDLQQTKALPNIRSKCLVDSDSEIHWWFVMNIYNIYNIYIIIYIYIL